MEESEMQAARMIGKGDSRIWCDICQSHMIARENQLTHNWFFECSKYPKCNGTKPLEYWNTVSYVRNEKPDPEKAVALLRQIKPKLESKVSEALARIKAIQGAGHDTCYIIGDKDAYGLTTFKPDYEFNRAHNRLAYALRELNDVNTLLYSYGFEIGKE